MTYIFDFDGTLVDSMPVFAGTMMRILDEEGVAYPEDFVKIITPLGYAGTAKYARELGVTLSEEQFIARAIEYNTHEYYHTIPLKPHVEKRLLELKREGHSLNVLTASPHAVLDACLKRVGIYDLFDNVWSCDDFSCTKAETRIYSMAAERLGKSVEECTFVDDNTGAVSVAKQAGMISVGIFDESSADFADEMKRVSDRYIMDFSEL
jgi:HAD superfamily hydrolase (TIGR01509 family)